MSKPGRAEGKLSGRLLRLDLSALARQLLSGEAPGIRVVVGSGARYGGRYPLPALRREAAWIRERLDLGADVYAYFNNDSGGHAPRDALRLKGLVDSQ